MQVFRISSPLHDTPLPVAALPEQPHPLRWPDDPPPEARKPSPWRWLWVPGGFVFALAAPGPGIEAGERLGIALLMVLICAGIAAGFYIWRASTRPAIPAATFILAFLLTGLVGVVREDEQKTVTRDMHDAANRFATGLAPQDPPPLDVVARIAWASQWALSDLAGHYATLAKDRQINPSELPEHWLTSRYAADAGDYPQVRSYFVAYQAYLAEADSSTQRVFTARYRERLVEAGYTDIQAELMAASIPEMAKEAMKSRHDDFEMSGRLAASAFALHDHLVQADARAHYDAEANIARFDSNAERRRADTLYNEVEKLLDQRATLRAANTAAWQERIRAEARRYH